MIKRNGVEVMNARTGNVKIAKETIEICKNGKYTSLNGDEVDISQSLNQAIKGTVFYKPEDNIPGINFLDSEKSIIPSIEVTNETTTQAAVRLRNLGLQNIVALNFASARNQGGGFLSGAVAQEEDLCRTSGLYSCLKSKPLFYNANILCDDVYYTDGIIYSPNVPFFRNQCNLFLEDPYTLSIISAPAPNLNGAQEIDHKKVSDVLATRAIRILDIAAAHGHKNIILGAWGCGAFGNSPALVANIFKASLLLTPAFENVCFAVYDTREPPVVYESFKEVYSPV